MSIYEDGIVEQFLSAPLWQKALVLIVGILIVFFTLKNIVFYGHGRKIDQLKVSLSQQEQSIASYKSLLSTRDEIKGTLKGLESSTNNIVISEQELPALLGKLTTLSLNGLKITNIRPGKETDNGKILLKSLYISCEGGIAQITEYARMLREILPSSVIDSFIVTRRGKAYYYSELFLTIYLRPERK